MMIAFADMMKKKIVMPAQFIRESGGDIASAFVDFSNAAQRLGVYTTFDYIEIMRKLNKYWDIENIGSLTDSAERARDYMVRLPDRMQRIAPSQVFIKTENGGYMWDPVVSVDHALERLNAVIDAFLVGLFGKDSGKNSDA